MSSDNDTLADFIFNELTTQNGWTNNSKGTGLKLHDIHRIRASLPMLLNFYNAEMDRTNTALFRYMEDNQKKDLQSRLRFSWLLLSAQHQLDHAEDRKYALDGLNKRMDLCQDLLDKLDLSTQEPSPERELEQTISPDKPLKYLGLTTIAPYIVTSIMGFINGEVESFSAHMTGNLIGAMSAVNAKRLYWVWAGGLLSSVLDTLADDFYNKVTAEKGVSAPAPYTGYMSWILYYSRFGIHLGLLLKHTVLPSLVKSSESDIPAGERFTTQWNLRKFSLLNDSIWATANMACFFWLRGGGTLGYLGNVLTAGLLLMDISLTLWRFQEEITAHNKNIMELQQTKENLQKAISPNERLMTNEDREDIDSLKSKIADLDKLIRKTEFDWKYQRYNTINDLVYATGLLIAFGLLCCFFYPPALIPVATQMIYGVAGAALCFVLTVAYPAISGGIEISKSGATGVEAREEAAWLLEKFKIEPNENIKKMLYLEMKGLMSDSGYQQQMAHFQSIKLLRSVIIDTLIPAVIFAALVFLPFGTGLVVLAAGLALGVLSKMVIDQFEPKADNLPSEDEDFGMEYIKFLKAPVKSLAHFEKNFVKSQAFFDSSSKIEEDKNSVNNDDDLEYNLN